MKIFFVNGVRGGDEVEFALPEITIGRDDGNILRIPTEAVSRYHARLRQNESGVWTISDQGSTNGVKLNRVRIGGERELAEGDLIEIGDQMIRVTGLNAEPPKVIFNPIPSVSPFHADGERPLEPEAAPGTAVEGPLAASEPPLIPPAATGGAEAKSDAVESGSAGMRQDLAALLGGRAGALFDRSRRVEEQPAGGATEVANEEGGKSGSRRRISNLTFYTVIGVVAVVVITSILRWMGAGAGRQVSKAAASEPPLSVFFEKEIKAPDNVFRFAMQLENDRVTFTLDDLKAQRHYQRTFEKLNAGAVSILRSRIRSSGIRAMVPPAEPRTKELITRRLVIAERPELLEFRITGRFVPAEFEAVEKAIDDFAESYGLQTISLTPEELRNQAAASFAKAEDLYSNREARPANLRDAIDRYRQVVNYLEQFSPHPPLWDRAKRRLAEAEELRQRKLDNLEYERVRLGGIRDFQRMRQVFLQVMELADQESPEFDIARQRLFKLDNYLGKMNR